MNIFVRFDSGSCYNSRQHLLSKQVDALFADVPFIFGPDCFDKNKMCV